MGENVLTGANKIPILSGFPQMLCIRARCTENRLVASIGKKWQQDLPKNIVRNMSSRFPITAFAM